MPDLGIFRPFDIRQPKRRRLRQQGPQKMPNGRNAERLDAAPPDAACCSQRLPGLGVSKSRPDTESTYTWQTALPPRLT
jgi:hypothetical protein